MRNTSLEGGGGGGGLCNMEDREVHMDNTTCIEYLYIVVGGGGG